MNVPTIIAIDHVTFIVILSWRVFIWLQSRPGKEGNSSWYTCLLSYMFHPAILKNVDIMNRNLNLWTNWIMMIILMLLDSAPATWFILTTQKPWVHIWLSYTKIEGQFYVSLIGNLKCSPMFVLSMSVISGCDGGTNNYWRCCQRFEDVRWLCSMQVAMSQLQCFQPYGNGHRWSSSSLSHWGTLRNYFLNCFWPHKDKFNSLTSQAITDSNINFLSLNFYYWPVLFSANNRVH